MQRKGKGVGGVYPTPWLSHQRAQRSYHGHDVGFAYDRKEGKSAMKELEAELGGEGAGQDDLMCARLESMAEKPRTR